MSGHEELAAKVIATALSRGLHLTTAESCTAGALAVLLADAPDAGKVFEAGFVTYSKAIKTRVLAVPQELIIRETAVSANVAIEMARGALIAAEADIAIAVTGVAGPKPDEDGNKVGLTHVACVAHDGTVREACYLFHDANADRKDSRDAIRAHQIEAALSLMLATLSDTSSGRNTGERTAQVSR
jgi:nicotinamide-nucleotide amidase